MDAIALEGHEPGDPDDRFVLVAGAVLDQPRVAGLVSKDRREDIQVLSFLNALSIVGGPHPLQLSEGEDPPDRYVEAGGARWAVELTELTIQDFRGELAQMRRFGRELESELAASPDHEHLVDRTVQLSIATQTGNELPRDTADLRQKVADALREDKGFLGEGADLSEGLPEKLPNRGMYGQIGPVGVDVGQHGRVSQITVASTPQIQLRHKEAKQALEGRVAEKDNDPNRILVVSCGFPDEHGYVCQVDNFVFQALWEVRAAQEPAGPLVPEPSSLDGVVVQQFAGNLLVAYQRPGVPLPWSPRGV